MCLVPPVPKLTPLSQHVSKSPEPPLPPAPPRPMSFESGEIGRGEYQAAPQERRRANSHSTRQSTTTTQVSEKHTNTIRRDSGIQIPPTSHQHARQGSISHTLTNEPQAGVLDTLPAPAPLAPAGADLELGNSTKPDPRNANVEQWLTRRPPEKPVLKPETRYCFTEGFTKPVRTHHCRACGTVCLMTLLLLN